MKGGRKRHSLPKLTPEVEAPVPFAVPTLLVAFLLPNIGALWCGFVLDDLPLIVENPTIHSLRNLGKIWSSGYWPDRAGLTLYRPVTGTLWAAIWSLGGARPEVFHAANLSLGALVVVLLYRLLRIMPIDPQTSFAAALLFALFPIHTEATTSVVGSSELFVASFGIGALICWQRGHRVVALILFALAVFSKESAAALAGVAWLIAEKPRKRFVADAIAALAIIAAVLVARGVVASGPSFVPPIDNPMSLLPAPRRMLSALWVQCLYLWKMVVPVTLSADYSYKQIPLVMNLADLRAWGGIGLIVAGLAIASWKKALAPPILVYAILFLPTANILFPIGTMMGERLAYLPSAAVALGIAIGLRPASRRWVILILSLITLTYGARTVYRNLDWRTADTFYSRLVQTSPNSAKAHHFYGTLLASRGDDAGAIAQYNRAIKIFPAYSESFHNRANALARLGRRIEAMESYRAALRFDPGHAGAAENLRILESGGSVYPPRRRLWVR